MDDPNVDFTITRLKITAYKELKDGRLITEIGSIELYLNPEDVTSSYAFPSTSKKSGGSNTTQTGQGAIVDIKNVESTHKVSFKITLDSTGAIPNSKNVSADIAMLEKILVLYEGDIHSTPYVEVVWGELYIVGQAEGLSVKYELFDAQANPIRASTSLTFTEFQTPETKALKKNRKSPDLSHVRTVRDGDTLPLMCNDVYRDPTYYLQVARINQLSNFQDLSPGQRILFPPLV